LRHIYTSSTPLKITLSIAIVSLFTIAMFFVFNYLVEKRQRSLLKKAVQSTAIVSSLFPKQVRDRLLDDDQQEKDKSKLGNSFNNDSDDEDMMQNNKQIADFFPNCTGKTILL
jgi:hypothetical protein